MRRTERCENCPLFQRRRKCGEPETYLLLMDPAKDRTVSSGGEGAAGDDRFSGSSRQQEQTAGKSVSSLAAVGNSFVFPKSLRAFAGRTVVGIKYDLLSAR